METFISILRGINVSGQKKIIMLDLKALYEDLGFHNVKTYIQSGNVVFKSVNEKNLNKKIETKIFEKYNFFVPVIIRNLEEIKNALLNNPLLKEDDIDVSKLHITFLEEGPLPENIEKLKEIDQKPDLFKINKKDIYLYTPNGYGNTKLNNNFFEKKLKTNATTRNWKTVNELLKIANEISQNNP